MYSKIDYNKIHNLHKEGIKPGMYIGFNCLRDYYSVKLGHTTYIQGIPGHGKTEIHFEILINLSEFYGWKHLVWSPETGTDERIGLELINKYLKSTVKHSEADFEAAYLFVSEHFFIMNPKEKTVTEILKISNLAIKEQGINTISIDPWNELNHDMQSVNNREDKYLAFTLGQFRTHARDNNIHTFLIVHPRTLREKKDGAYSPPTFYEFSGGAEWANKGEMIICPYRERMIDESNRIINEVTIIIQKGKPKEAGRKGSVTLFYDMEKSRYYEKDKLTEIPIFASKEPNYRPDEKAPF